MKTTELGSIGLDIINDTSPHDGKWFFIKARSAVVFAVLRGSKIRLNGSEVPELTNFPLAVGDYVHGDFTRIKLTSGEVLAQAQVP